MGPTGLEGFWFHLPGKPIHFSQRPPMSVLGTVSQYSLLPESWLDSFFLGAPGSVLFFCLDPLTPRKTIPGAWVLGR